MKYMNELIYKQEAIDLVKNVCNAIISGCDSHYDPEIRDEIYNDILEVDAILKCNKEIRIALGNLPSVQIGQKKGKWIDSRNVSWMCSECGKWLDVLQGDVDMNFCPNCGADMREPFTIPTEIIESAIGYDD